MLVGVCDCIWWWRVSGDDLLRQPHGWCIGGAKKIIRKSVVLWRLDRVQKYAVKYGLNRIKGRKSQSPEIYISLNQMCLYKSVGLAWTRFYWRR